MADHLTHNNVLGELMHQLRQARRLTREEEHDLAIRLKEHDDHKAEETLVTANLRSVMWIAMGYAGYGLPIEDIFQEGAMGLMIAVRKFDPYKGCRVMTYATWWVKAMIHDYIFRFISQVRLSSTKLHRMLFYGLNRLEAVQELVDKSFSEQSWFLSRYFDADPKEIEEIMTRLTNRDQSLDNHITGGSDTSFLDCLADTMSSPEERIMDSQRTILVRSKLYSAMDNLTPRERHIMKRRIMADRPDTLEDIGNMYAISKERVRQIENHSILKLKKALAPSMELMMPA